MHVAAEAVLAGVGIGPDVRGQVGVGVIDARVDHRHHHVAAAGRDVPGLGGVDVVAGRPAALSRVVQRPLLRELGVVGHRRVDLLQRIGFEPGNLPVGLQGRGRLGGRGAVGAHQHFAHRAETFEDLELHAALAAAEPLRRPRWRCRSAAAVLNCTIQSSWPLALVPACAAGGSRRIAGCDRRGRCMRGWPAAKSPNQPGETRPEATLPASICRTSSCSSRRDLRASAHAGPEEVLPRYRIGAYR